MRVLLKMKHLLIIILERDSATGICVNNVARSFVKQGCKVDILSYKTDKEEESIEGITRHYIPAKFFLRPVYSGGSHLFVIKSASVLFSLQVALFSLFCWPFNSPMFSSKLNREVRKLYQKYEYDAIIPVYTQIDPLIASYKLKKKYGYVKYFPYFLDSLSGGPTPRLLSKSRKIAMGLKWEKYLLSKADGIVLMKASEKHHQQYSSKMPYYPIMKFLDLPMLIEPSLKHDCRVRENDIIAVTYVGSMPLNIRNPYYGFNVLSQIDNIKINVVGPIPQNEYYLKYCSEHSINLIGKVPHSEIAKYVEESDVLLNFGNTVSEMTPSKIFEYMSYGKPIVSFSAIKEDSSIPYLEQYSDSCIIFEYETMESSINSIRLFIMKQRESRISFDVIRKQFELNTPENFTKYILEALAGTDEISGR